MQRKKYIYQHLGLGDHIICNGLVREIIAKEPETKFYIFCKSQYNNSVCALFKDCTSLSVIPLPGDLFVHLYLHVHGCLDKLVVVGHYADPLPEGVTWDEFFYHQHNVPFQKRWDAFYLERNLEREGELFNKVNPQGEPFLLLHNVGSDGIDRIDYSVLSKKLKVIKVAPGLTSNVFEFYKLIEEAEEIHCVDSFFHHLVDSIESTAKLYYHDKPEPRNKVPHRVRKDWIFV